MSAGVSAAAGEGGRVPSSIDSHKPDCPCPACQGRRNERPARSPMLGFRVDPDVHAWLNARPEGPRRWLESAVAQAQGGEPKSRAWWYDHIHAIVVAAVRDVDRLHGDPGEHASSVAKRVAAQLAEELTRS